MLHLLSTDASFISWDPEERNLGCHRRRVISILGDGFFVHVVHIKEALGNELTESVVVGINVGSEELGEQVGLLDRWGGSGDFAAGLLFDVLGTVAGSCFDGAEEAFLLGFKRAREAVEERVKSRVEGEVVEDGKDEEDDHADQGSWALGDAEESDEADFGEVDSR